MAIGQEAKLCHVLALEPGRKTGSHPCPLHIGQLVAGVRGLDLESDSLGLNLNSAANRSDLPSLFPHFIIGEIIHLRPQGGVVRIK